MNADLFAPWPEPKHVREMRAAIDAIRTYCQSHTTGLGTLAHDSISARAVLALLPEEDCS